MKILWLKTELMHPVDKGGKIRTNHMLKQLKREHKITYITLDDGTAAPDACVRAEEYCDELVCIPHETRRKFSAGFYSELALNMISPLPYFISKYRSALMQRVVLDRVHRYSFDVVVCDFLVPSINMPDGVPCATVLFQHNVEAMIWKRRYSVERNPLKKAYLYSQWRKAHAFEKAVCKCFDHVVAVSREDRETMEREYGVESVSDVPTGVDADYFRPHPVKVRDRHGLVFTGSMDWLPNEDGITFFAEQVLPRIRKSVPDVTLTVVGRNPSRRIMELSRKDPSIVVTGRVEDVRPYMEGASAYVVPLRIGGGTRLKIFEAMAMGLPVISTSVGAEGLPVRHGTELLLANTPEAFAHSVVSVLTHELFARRLGTQAAAMVREQFDWKKVAMIFAETCRKAADLRNGKKNALHLQRDVRKAV